MRAPRLLGKLVGRWTDAGIGIYHLHFSLQFAAGSTTGMKRAIYLAVRFGSKTNFNRGEAPACAGKGDNADRRGVLSTD